MCIRDLARFALRFTRIHSRQFGVMDPDAILPAITQIFEKRIIDDLPFGQEQHHSVIVDRHLQSNSFSEIVDADRNEIRGRRLFRDRRFRRRRGESLHS